MNENNIQGNPTKSFFIEMITRDISIQDAILDLLDNSIDGANRIYSESYRGREIEIILTKDEFIVKDNCGGFSLDTAKKYAFRFGRPDDAPPTEGSIGRFGIGMKRSLFKMGNYFEVETKTETDHFQVSVDVKTWKTKTKTVRQGEDNIEIDDWDFQFENLTAENAQKSNLSEPGTYIKVSNLFPQVGDLYQNNTFQNQLKEDIEKLLNFSIEKKIKIKLNGKVLKSKNIYIFSEISKPYVYEGNKDGVTFRVIAGLGEIGDPSKSGWYIYCNDRLVVEADRSELTGWVSPKKWHIDHVMFRGIVFLDSAETIKLPLTTTKKGIDATSEIYKIVLVYMKEAMNNILPFLKEITKLGSDANEYRKSISEQESKVTVVEMKVSSEINTQQRRFVPPPDSIEHINKSKHEEVRISYSVPKKKFEIAMEASNSKSTKELGEYTFNYYLKMEDLENE